MKAIIKGKKELVKWLTNLISTLHKRARKETKRYKDRPPKQTAWEIILNI